MGETAHCKRNIKQSVHLQLKTKLRIDNKILRSDQESFFFPPNSNWYQLHLQMQVKHMQDGVKNIYWEPSHHETLKTLDHECAALWNTQRNGQYTSVNWLRSVHFNWRRDGRKWRWYCCIHTSKKTSNESKYTTRAVRYWYHNIMFHIIRYRLDILYNFF